MRFFRRPLVPGESDPELLWGSVLGAAALLAAGWFLTGLPTPRCPLHGVTGLPCPTCGATRSASALLHGEIAAAFAWNPLVTLALMVAAFYVLYAAVVVIGKLPRLRCSPPSPKESRRIRISVIILIATDWAYLLWKGV